MNRCLITTAVALMALSTVATARGMRFALVPKAMNNPFFDQARDGCYKAASELLDIECYYIGPAEHTEMEQIQIVQDLITQGVDGIAVSPSNAPAMGKALRRAKAAGIAVITWDSDLLESDRANRTTYVGTKNYDIGVHLAQLAKKMKPRGGSVCLQTGGASAANHNERLQGIRDTLGGMSGTTSPGKSLTGQKGWTEVDGCPLITDDDNAKAVQGLADILNKYNDLDVFISTGGFTQWSNNAYRQAIAPHRGRMDQGELIFVAADTLPMQMQQLRAGASHGQVGQRPFEMGYKAMYVLKDIKAGKKVDDPINTGLDVCDQSNASSCLAH